MSNGKLIMFVIFFIGLLFVSAAAASDNSTVTDAVMEKTDNIQKITTGELLDMAVELGRLARKCHQIGLIDDYSMAAKVSTEADFAVEVRTDMYMASELKWSAEANSYVDAAPVDAEAIRQGYEEMRGRLAGMLAARRAQLEYELEIIGG